MESFYEYYLEIYKIHDRISGDMVSPEQSKEHKEILFPFIDKCIKECRNALIVSTRGSGVEEIIHKAFPKYVLYKYEGVKVISTSLSAGSEFDEESSIYVQYPYNGNVWRKINTTENEQAYKNLEGEKAKFVTIKDVENNELSKNTCLSAEQVTRDGLVKKGIVLMTSRFSPDYNVDLDSIKSHIPNTDVLIMDSPTFRNNNVLL